METMRRQPNTHFELKPEERYRIWQLNRVPIRVPKIECFARGADGLLNLARVSVPVGTLAAAPMDML
jgi:hypothetical protein